ncbi:hypothetical protein FACS189492_0020 [Clostridia bacterium]|nr:hypothetical protein FACS189492_0020 [Clostridia bacterium]
MNENQLTYTRVGDCYLPNIKLRDLAQDVPAPNAPPLGLYRRMYKAFLREYKPILYNQLLLSEKLYPLCREIDEAAANRLLVNADREQAHEIILAELIYE